jgi:hypothetical protein
MEEVVVLVDIGFLLIVGDVDLGDIALLAIHNSTSLTGRLGVESHKVGGYGDTQLGCESFPSEGGSEFGRKEIRPIKVVEGVSIHNGLHILFVKALHDRLFDCHNL